MCAVYQCGIIHVAIVYAQCGSVAKAQNPVTIILPAIKAAAAVHLAVITHVAALCSLAYLAFGNQAKAARVALTQTAPMVLSLNGVIKATAIIHLVFVAKVK